MTRVSKFVPYFSFNFSNGDYQGLSDYMLHSDFTSYYLTQDCEHIWHIIEQKLFEGMQLYFLSTRSIPGKIQHGKTLM